VLHSQYHQALGFTAVSKYAREAAEFVIYIPSGGDQPLACVSDGFDLLRERREVLARHVKITEAKVREFISSGKALSDSGFEGLYGGSQGSWVDQAWAWTRASQRRWQTWYTGCHHFHSCVAWKRCG
jgi:hypothetical protein